MMNPPGLFRSNRWFKQTFVATVAGVLLVGLPAPSRPAPAQPASTQGAIHQVSMINNEFSPQYLQIDVGDTVVWVNEDDETHTVDDNGHQESSGEIFPGETWEKTFTSEGYWGYHCMIHSPADSHGLEGMIGTIIVGNPPQRGVSLVASTDRATFGKSFSLSGQVGVIDPRGPACSAGVPVRLEKDVLGAPSEFTAVDSKFTDSSSRYAFNRTADAGARYRVVAEEHQPCTGEVQSVIHIVEVAKKVVLSPSATRVRKGRRVALNVSVKPCEGHAGEPVDLLKKRDGKFVKIASKSTTQDCKATFTQRMRRSATFKAKSPQTDDDHLTGTSTVKMVRVR